MYTTKEVTDFKLIMDNLLRERDVNLDQIADECYIHRGHLIRDVYHGIYITPKDLTEIARFLEVPRSYLYDIFFLERNPR